jgi:hypothetical protein
MRQRHNRYARLVGCMLLVAALAVHPVSAQDDVAHNPPSDSGGRELVWLAASATLLSASVGGLFALRVNSLYHQAEALPGVSPERLTLKRETARAELTADCLFAGAAGLLATTLVLIWLGDWSLQPTAAGKPRGFALPIVPVATERGAGLLVRGELP